MSDPSSDGTESGFFLTDSQINLANILALASTIPGTCICFLCIVAYGIAACFPRPRRHLDRVSFRLIFLTLVFNVIFGIAYAATPASPGPSCNFGAFVINITLAFSTFFTTCIAINLELVLVHGVNGRKMEKYYIIGTTVLSLALNVPTFALHQFGWDEQSSTCWYKNPDDDIKLKWIIGTFSFWLAFASTVESICSIVVIVWVFRAKRLSDRLLRRAASSSSNAETSSSSSSHVEQDIRYRNIILRIALYPIVSLIANYSAVVLDLYTTIRGLNSNLDFRLLILDLVLYGIRTLAYGLLASSDPSFISALREIRGSQKRTDGTSASSNQTLTQMIPQYTTMGTSGFETQQSQVSGSEKNVNEKTQWGTDAPIEMYEFERNL
ncbi:hypothetical protein C8J56DRAFT_819933 [Mycena floridula]|nr:hypothetical protein C8J56DRAFT_819933 [Mycena floridula]